MRVSDLYRSETFKGQDVYIVGLGSSMEVFPTEFLNGRCTILLNDAHRYFTGWTPCIFTNHLEFVKTWEPGRSRYVVVKGRKKGGGESDDNHCPWDHDRFHVFSYVHEDPFDNDRPDHFSWIVGNVAHFAIQFALRGGARSIILVGCDSCKIGERFYHHGARTSFRNRHLKKNLDQTLKDRYDGYHKGFELLRRFAWIRHNVPILTLSPFAGLDRYEQQMEDILKMREECNASPLG